MSKRIAFKVIQKVDKTICGADLEVGNIVYQYSGHDYGLCRDDEAHFKEPYGCFCHEEESEGAVSFFTVPLRAVEKI